MSMKSRLTVSFGALIVLAMAVDARGQVVPGARQAPGQDRPGETSPDGVKDVARDEIAGRVVDEKGKPVAGVEVDLYHWVPKHPVTRTDADGVFRFKKLDRVDDGQHVRIRPAKYAWQEFMMRKPGAAGWLVTLRDDTKIEGRLIDREGKPVADARVVADQGPRMARGYRQGQTVTEVKTGADGRYTLFVEPAGYDIAIRVAGKGVARQTVVAEEGQVTPLDLKLSPGVNFTALFIDSESGQPVPGATLSHWQKPGIEGIADERGVVVIRDVPPGAYDRFEVKADGYARWWCEQAKSPWARKQADANQFQRNFDSLDFDVTPDFGPITIEIERCVTVRGHVLDPDGQKVAGATVAPAKTGSGNSLTGDTRFSVRTDKDGRYVCFLPASHTSEYNLVAHDGDYQEWRKWANGASKTMTTQPGQEIKNFDLTLTRPATVSGRVVDAAGKPVVGREVRFVPAAMDENRYYDPTAKTDADGKFAIKFARPGEGFVQVAPFWLDPKQAPPGTSAAVSTKPGEKVEGVELTAQPDR